jgi:hypothetical protein
MKLSEMISDTDNTDGKRVEYQEAEMSETDFFYPIMLKLMELDFQMLPVPFFIVLLTNTITVQVIVIPA